MFKVTPVDGSLGKGQYIQPRKCVHSHRGGPESWPPEPVRVTFLFQMKQIKNRVNPVTFLKKKNAQNDVCVYSACRSAAIMLSVLCSGTTWGGAGGAWAPSAPKWVGHTNCPNPMSFFIGSGGGDDSVGFSTCRSGYRIISVWTESIALACQIAKFSSGMEGSSNCLYLAIKFNLRWWPHCRSVPLTLFCIGNYCNLP